jgi:hypothetical protein
MASSFQLTDGVTDIELVYNSSTQTNYKLQYGAALNSGGVSPKWFESDNFPPELIDLVDTNRQVFLTLNVKGANRDTVLNKIALLKRWVDGAHQEASRYWLENGATRRIDLRVQIDGATNATMHPVIYGEVDDSGSHYTDFAELNKFAQEITIMLMLAPYGEAETALTLRNDLPSSPGMIEDSDGDSIPDGVNEFGTPTAVFMSSTPSLTFDSTVVVTVPATGSHGIETDTIAATVGTTVVAFADITRFDSGSLDPITIAVVNGAGTVLATAEFDPANPTGYDATFADISGGYTWYRYSVATTITGAANCLLRVYRNTLDATGACTFIVDKWYLQLNATTSPATAWVSSKTLYNRYDPVATSATTQQYINYFDVWGIPGDAPALSRYKLVEGTVANTPYISMGKILSGSFDAALFDHWYEAEDADVLVTADAAATTPADANRSGGAYLRITYSGAAAATARFYVTGDAAKRLASIVWGVYAVVRSTSTTRTFTLDGVALNVDNNAPVSVASANQWEPLFLGTVNGTGQLYNDAPDAVTANHGFEIQMLGSSGTDDIDFVFLTPMQLQDTNILIDRPTWTTLYIDGRARKAYPAGNSIGVNRLGELWTLQPGELTQRVIFGMYTEGTDGWVLLDNWTVELSVTTRTRHLLGTI